MLVCTAEERWNINPVKYMQKWEMHCEGKSCKLMILVRKLGHFRHGVLPNCSATPFLSRTCSLEWIGFASETRWVLPCSVLISLCNHSSVRAD